MIQYMIVAATSLALFGLTTLYIALKGTADGYEDEFGFHQGPDRQREMAYATVSSGRGQRTQSGEVRIRRMSKRAGSASVSRSASSTFYR